MSSIEEEITEPLDLKQDLPPVGQEKPWQKYFFKKQLLSPKTRYRILRAKKSYRYFFEQMRGFVAAVFHVQIIEVLEDRNHLIVLIKMPRGHGKSTLGCENFVAHYGIYHPGHYCLIFSRTALQAYARGKAIKDIVAETPEYAHLAREEGQPKWGTKEFYLRNNFYVQMAGAGGSIAGAKHINRRPDIIILDDVVPENLGGTMTDEKIETWWMETVVNLGHNKTKIIILGTPYRQNDLIDFLSKPVKDKAMIKYAKPIKLLHFEALLGKDIEALEDDTTPVLWPQEKSLSFLRQKFYGDMRKNALVFARQYLCRTVDEGAKLYPLKYVERAKSTELKFARSLNEFQYEYEDVIQAVDIAKSAQAGADYFVSQIWGVTPKGKFDLVWIERHRGLAFKEQKALIVRLMQRYNPHITVIEVNGYQSVLADDVEELGQWVVYQHTTTAQNKFDELVGLPTVRSHLENRRIRYPCAPDQEEHTQMTFQHFDDEDGNPKVKAVDFGGEPVINNLNALFDEMAGWQHINGKWETVMAHDDTVLTQWFAVLGFEKSAAFKVSLMDSIPSETETKTGVYSEYLQPNWNKGDYKRPW